MKLYDMLEQDTQIKRLAKNNGERTLKPLSKKTILEHHRPISAMLHKAVYWQLIPYNPADRVQPPRAPKAQRKFYDDEQCRVLLMGLDWENIDFKNKEISVNKSSQYLASTGVYTKTPKTPSSYKHISIPNSVIEILEKYKLWYDGQKELCGEFWEESNRLFVQDDGKPMHSDTVSK